MIQAAPPRVLPPFQAQSLFSLGYQLRDLDEFLEALDSADIDAVIDVRQTAFSRKAGFSKNRLAEALAARGIDYVHADFAGNPKKLRRDSSSHEEVLDGFAAHLKENPSVLTELSRLVRRIGNRRRVCLVCYERHPDDCHRAILVRQWQLLAERDFAVRHLGVGGAPRLIAE